MTQGSEVVFVGAGPGLWFRTVAGSCNSSVTLQSVVIVTRLLGFFKHQETFKIQVNSYLHFDPHVDVAAKRLC